MTLREKVGQLFFVRPDALDPAQEQEQIDDADAGGVTALTDAMSAVLAGYPVGGVVLFGKNITGPQQLTDLTGQLHAAMDTPLLIAVDEEGGAVARLANHPAFDLPRYESAAAVAAAGGAQAVQQMYAEIGGYLDSYGIDLDFAPDADVNTNPDNPVIGTRAFSSDPQTAAELVAAAVEALRIPACSAASSTTPATATPPRTATNPWPPPIRPGRSLPPASCCLFRPASGRGRTWSWRATSPRRR